MAIITHNIPSAIPKLGGSYSIDIENDNTPNAEPLHIRFVISQPWVVIDPSNLTILYDYTGNFSVEIEKNTIDEARSCTIKVFGMPDGLAEELLGIIQFTQQPQRRVIIPTANPIRFSIAGINQKETAKVDYVTYYQKFQKTDCTTIQLLVPEKDEAKDWNITVFNEHSVKMPYTFEKKTMNDLIDGYEVQEFEFDFSQFSEGLYRFELYSTSGITYKSDFICVREKQDYTVLLSYSNSANTQNVAFSSGVMFNLRVESEPFNDLLPKSNNSIYSDNMGGFKTLSSDPFNNNRFNIGGRMGIPDWLMSIVNQAFSCDVLYADYERINKVEGAEFEALSSGNYSLRSWNIEVSKDEDEFEMSINGKQHDTVDVEYTAGTITATLICSTDFEIIKTSDWIDAVYESISARTYKISIQRTQNPINDIRSAVLTFKSSIGKRVTLTINQDAGPIHPPQINNYIGFNIDADEIRAEASAPVVSQLAIDILIEKSYNNGQSWTTYNDVATIPLGEQQSYVFMTIDNTITNIKCTVTNINPSSDSHQNYLIGEPLEWNKPHPIYPLIIDAPLDGNGLDISGNNNHLTAGPNVQWATIDGRQVLAALNDNSYFDLISPATGMWINNFRLEVDIRRNSATTDPSYPNFVDSAHSGDTGIFTQIEGNIFYIGMVLGGVKYVLSTQTSNVLKDKWYRLIIQKQGTNVYAGIIDISSETPLVENTVLMSATAQTRTNLRIGRGAYYYNRYANAFIRNLKIWDLS